MSKILFGKVIKYGNNIDTDVIIPARFLNTSNPKELAKHCMEDIDSEYKNRMHNGEIMVAGKNFGCGSSREHAPIAIKASGISCIIAESFARIFFRNAINIGLPIIELKNALEIIDSEDSLEINLVEGSIKNISKGTLYKIKQHPEFMQEIIKSGGLIEMIKDNLMKNNSD